jgi:hypothetical protein
MINFNPKNLTPSVLNGKNSIAEEFLGARDFKVLTQFDRGSFNPLSYL